MKFKVGEKYEVTEGSEKGNVIEIERIGEGLARNEVFYKTVRGRNLWCASFCKDSAFASWLKPIEKECIVIYRDGAETIALDKTTGKKAVAKCSPDDTYDFYTGAKLAFERLTGCAVREVKRRAKAGEYVKIVNARQVPRTNGKPEYKNGDILKIISIVGSYVGYKKGLAGNGLAHVLNDDEYVVLEGYKPPKDEKPAFKPHLEYKGTCYGFLGDATPLKDVIGRELRVGDTVKLYNEDNICLGERVVCYTERENMAFVCGIAMSCRRDGTIKGDWKVILEKKYENIADGEVVDGIKYIKGEVQHA